MGRKGSSIAASAVAALTLLLGASCTPGVEHAPSRSAETTPSQPATQEPQTPPETIRPEDPTADSCTSADGGLTVHLNATSEPYVATFKFAQASDIKTRDFMVSLWGSNYGPDGSGPSFQLLARWDGAGPAKLAHFDFGTARQSTIPGTAVASGDTIAWRFSPSYFEALGEGWSWSAAVSDNGEDVYLCPDGYGSQLQYPSENGDGE